MSQKTLRFIHASDFHLEQPLGGIAQVPPELREVFLEAPFQAASRVFEAALAEGVDAVLLAGDLIHCELAGPRGVIFLLDQFRRLHDHQIPVYWACGSIDAAETWPACAKLPPNVHVFSTNRVQNLELRRGDEIVARIQGISRSPGSKPVDSGFHRDPHGVFTVGISYGTSASPETAGDRVDYMALGGQHRRQTIDQSPGIAHYCGTPQGRTPQETGSCGCTLVLVDETGHVKTNYLATDCIRWLQETIEITAGTDEDGLVLQIEDRISKLRNTHHGSELLVTWEITGRGQVLNHIRRGGISDEIVSLLRNRHTAHSPRVWTVALECDSPLDVPQEWVDEETIMGDLLRDFRKLERDADIDLELAEFLPEGFRHGSYAQMAEELSSVTPVDRAHLLWAASKLGVDLMDGEEVLSVEG